MNDCQGVWIDAFQTDWVSFPLHSASVSKESLAQKQLCLVSPELHKRATYQATWQQWQQQLEASTLHAENLLLCTDFPMAAFLLFNPGGFK